MDLKLDVLACADAIHQETCYSNDHAWHMHLNLARQAAVVCSAALPQAK